MALKIGLIGAPGSGKDTFADFLAKHKNFKKLAFANQIKQEYYKVMNLTDEYFKSVRNLPEEKEIRDGLWSYSDQMRKNHGKLHFITPVIEKITSCNENVVITDIRTKDELERAGKVCGVVILIIRDLKLDKSSQFFPGTRLKFTDIMGIPVLWNYCDSLECAHTEFNIFYNDIVLKMF